jgi:hypothetical protein
LGILYNDHGGRGRIGREGVIVLFLFAFKICKLNPRLIREALEIRKCKEYFNRNGGLKINHTWDHILKANKNKMNISSSILLCGHYIKAANATASSYPLRK